jgi:hypothetical protein
VRLRQAGRVRHRSPWQPPGRGARWAAAASVVLMLLSATALVAVLSGGAPPGVTRPARLAAADPPAPGAVPRPLVTPTLTPTRPPAREAPAGAGAQPRGWRAVLGALDRRRARAYAEANPGLLRRVYAEGSPVLRQDRALLERYHRQGLRVSRLRLRLLEVRMRAGGDERVVLLVRERLAGGVINGRGSRSRSHLEAGGVERHVVVLRQTAAPGWRIAAVRPAAA